MCEYNQNKQINQSDMTHKHRNTQTNSQWKED